MAAAIERTRLHITPFNLDLLDRYVPASLKPQATNISFHTVETFPERGFGYVELPAMEAQKLRKKLNGSTLKGAKVRIEEARPERKRRKSEETAEDDYGERKKAKKEERKKKEKGMIPGHELEEGRRVKRGWDEKNPGRKSKREEEGLEGKKMRFKTVVPANKVEVEGKEKKQKKDKKEKKGKSDKKTAVVKEFAKTTKVMSKGAVGVKRNVSYEDGVGWVDEEGNVVEEEPPQKKRKRSKAKKESPEPVAEPVADSEPETAENQDGSDAENEAGDAHESNEQDEKNDSDSDSHSGSDSEAETVQDAKDNSDDDEDEQVNLQLKQAQTNLASNAAAERERSNSVLVNDALPSAERDITPAADKEVHPLEALFKRPAPSTDEPPKAKKPTPIDTSFSFFNSGADEDEVMVTETNPPQTPHTKQDLEWRSMRSAAPTPDTAAIGKRFSFPFAAEDSVPDEDDDVDMRDDSGNEAETGAEKKDGEGEREESEFRKWFYENRGDLNRSWKKRRREEKKIVRQRENRRLSRRIA